MKTIEVVAAIIKDGSTVLATKRGYGEFINMWEFPGGKMEDGENKEGALMREIWEELSISIRVDTFVTTVEYDYDNFHLTMYCYICTQNGGCLSLNEHSDAKWVHKSELYDLAWLPADLVILDELKNYI